MRPTISEQILLHKIRAIDPDDYDQDPETAAQLAHLITAWPTLPPAQKIYISTLLFFAGIQAGVGVVNAALGVLALWRISGKLE